MAVHPASLQCVQGKQFRTFMPTRCPLCASLQGKQFSVIVTEGRPDETGLVMARLLEDLKVPVTVVLDSGVGYVMER